MSDNAVNIGNNTAGSAQEKMIAYMNAKYDDSFMYSAPFGGRIGAKTKQILVSSKKYPDKEIWVEYYEDNGSPVFHDNYIDHKFEQQTYEKIKEILDEAFDCDVKVIYDVGSGGTYGNFGATTTFDEYIHNQNSAKIFSAEVPINILDSDKDDMEKLMKEYFVNKNHMRVCGDIYFEDNTNLFFITNDEGFKTAEWS